MIEHNQNPSAEIDEIETEIQTQTQTPPRRIAMRIPVLEGQPLNSGTRIFVGSMPVEYLLDERMATVPYRNSLKKTGYQRRPNDARVSRLATAMEKKRTDVPTSILLNIRDVDVKDIMKKDGDDSWILDIDEDSEGVRLYVVDGQHRIEALRKLCTEDAEKWRRFNLQFVLMVGAGKYEEMSQFYMVNTEAKSVRTDLALELLKERVENDSRIMEAVIESGQYWKVEAQAIVEAVNKDSPVWLGKIRMPNADKGETVIPSTSFVTSLRPLLVNSPFFGALKENDQRVKVLDAYWQGIREVLREPFDEASEEYSLQKGIGATAMHELLVYVIEILRNRGGSVFDKDSYVSIMEPVLNDLEGENHLGEAVRGAAFWLNANRGGAAGTFSSSAGKRVLLAKLRSHLPDMHIV